MTNIQQLAAEKAREAYPLVPLEPSEDYNNPQAHNNDMQLLQYGYISAWQDCLNHLAGSEGDGVEVAIKLLQSNFSEKDFDFIKQQIAIIRAITIKNNTAKVLSQQWISVETPPELNEHLMGFENGERYVAVENFQATVLAYDEKVGGVFKARYFKGGQWAEISSNSHNSTVKPTHWQPLPTPPINQ